MSVKVVTQGSLVRRVTCKRCGSELEYEPSDVNHTSYEDSSPTYHIKCPLCFKEIGPGYGFVYVPNPGDVKA